MGVNDWELFIAVLHQHGFTREKIRRIATEAPNELIYHIRLVDAALERPITAKTVFYETLVIFGAYDKPIDPQWVIAELHARCVSHAEAIVTINQCYSAGFLKSEEGEGTSITNKGHEELTNLTNGTVAS